MRNIILLILAIILSVSLYSCNNTLSENIKEPRPSDTSSEETDSPRDTLAVKPSIVQMHSICELATLETYYHDVVKFIDEEAEGHLWWKKDKEFWIEYSGTIKVGIDASLVRMEISENNITITLPEAKILSCGVDELTQDSFYIAKNSAKITAEDEKAAFEKAEKEMYEKATKDEYLLKNAQERAKTLLEDYITNFGNVIGQIYIIEWVYVDDEGNLL